MGGEYISTEVLQANLQSGFDNLVWFAKQASQVELDNGLAWYSQAYNEAVTLAADYNLPLDRVIDVIACLSPQLRWSDNVKAAEAVIRYFLSGGFVPSIADYIAKRSSLLDLSRQSGFDLPIAANVTGANKVKALWILQGYNALSGQKVISFADNIRRFADSEAVTVDSHAILAWLGRIDQKSVTIGANSRFYDIIAADYKRLARLLHVSPLEAQAIVWIVRRRLSGSDKLDGANSVL
jgi:hypothetical protein